MADLVLARRLIKEAADQCLRAAQLADRHAAYTRRRDKEMAPKRLLLDATHAAISARVAAIDDAIKAAKTAADRNDYVAAGGALDSVLALLAAADRHKAGAVALKQRLDLLAPKVTGLTTASPRNTAPHIGAELALLDTELVGIQTALDTAPVDLKAITDRLDAATARQALLAARKDIKTAGTDAGVLKASLQSLCDQPDGLKQLDDLVATLSDPGDAELIKIAMAVRFKLEEVKTEGELDTAVLKRIHALMADVPAKHTRDNPALKKVLRKPSGGSAYGSGEITLGDSKNSINSNYPVAKPTEVMTVDPGCEPAVVDPPPKFFDWNTQHEIAHALDDKKGFMATRAGVAEFGGWQEHGGDVLTVAAAVVAALGTPAGLDAKMIATYIDRQQEPTPPPASWPKVKAWADGVATGQNPWKNGAACGKAVADGGFKVGTRIYHEAYPKTWVSYEAAARSKAITGYQFRAPGEWFSELYAAYKSKVLKPGHPAEAWLKKLFPTTA